MKKLILDTNAYIAYLSGDEKVLNILGEADMVYVSTIMVGELFAGFYGGKYFKRNKEFLRAFLAKPKVNLIEVNFDTAELFGEIKNTLRKQGTPIPLNDIWLAAHAVENGAIMVTFDKHFLNVRGLRLWDRE